MNSSILQALKEFCGSRVCRDLMRSYFADLVMLVTLFAEVVELLAGETD